MSILSHGISRLNCVCRCTKGFCSVESPAIHILAGLNVCIHVIRPIQFLAVLASTHNCVISSGVLSTGLNTTLHGIEPAAFSPSAIFWLSSATCLSVSGP
jgi:hypothetical protein